MRKRRIRVDYIAKVWVIQCMVEVVQVAQSSLHCWYLGNVQDNALYFLFINENLIVFKPYFQNAPNPSLVDFVQKQKSAIAAYCQGNQKFKEVSQQSFDIRMPYAQGSFRCFFPLQKKSSVVTQGLYLVWFHRLSNWYALLNTPQLTVVKTWCSRHRKR